jgi:ribosomal protein L29
MKRDELGMLRRLTVDQLKERANTVKTDLFETRFAIRAGHLGDFSRVRALRGAHAQILTIIAERRIEKTKQGAGTTR